MPKQPNKLKISPEIAHDVPKRPSQKLSAKGRKAGSHTVIGVKGIPNAGDAFKAPKQDRVRMQRLNREATGRQASEPTPTVYVDPLAAALHESMADLVALGHVSANELRSAEAVMLRPNTPPSGAAIKALRKREGATQAVFAHYLGVSVNTVSQWERGERAATGTSAKLLSLVARHGLTYIR